MREPRPGQPLHIVEPPTRYVHARPLLCTCTYVVVVVVVILMAFLVNLYPLRQLLYGYPILLYGVMLSIACACLLKWEETGVPGGNPRKHGENMQTPHRKARAGPETNPGPSCCEATALTTAPPCRPVYIRLCKSDFCGTFGRGITAVIGQYIMGWG